MKNIVWDVDDVLNDLMRSWLERAWLPKHPECDMTYEGIVENPPNRLLKVSLEDYLSSLDAYRLTPDYIGMEPNKEVLAWFRKHGEKARHVILTAAPLASADISARWVIRNFGQWIRSFNFIPSKRKAMEIPEYYKSKPEFIKWFGKADVFVEDTGKNIEGIEEKSLLISRPWNKSKDSMQEVLAKLTRIVK